MFVGILRAEPPVKKPALFWLDVYLVESLVNPNLNLLMWDARGGWSCQKWIKSSNYSRIKACISMKPLSFFSFCCSDSLEQLLLIMYNEKPRVQHPLTYLVWFWLLALTFSICSTWVVSLGKTLGGLFHKIFNKIFCVITETHYGMQHNRAALQHKRNSLLEVRKVQINPDKTQKLLPVVECN